MMTAGYFPRSRLSSRRRPEPRTTRACRRCYRMERPEVTRECSFNRSISHSLLKTRTEPRVFSESCARSHAKRTAFFALRRPDKEKPNVFALWEEYRDEAALESHIATEHFQRLVIRGVRMMAKQRSAETVFPIR